ncbi:MAG: hypothetical protein IJY36_02975 [Coprobacter sp.]|nr:hypothetical protein [Coprobacter sp.]
MRKSNYDKFPSTAIEARLIKGWLGIGEELGAKTPTGGVCVIECYQGVYMELLGAVVTRFPFDLKINSDDLFK